MAEQKMTLIERLTNPQWIHGPDLNAPAVLDKEQTLADMNEAALVLKTHVCRTNDNSDRAPFHDAVERASRALMNHYDDVGTADGFDEHVEILRKALESDGASTAGSEPGK